MKAKFFRRNHLIFNTDNKVVFDGQMALPKGKSRPSINAAKRESRRLQSLHGQGCVRLKV